MDAVQLVVVLLGLGLATAYAQGSEKFPPVRYEPTWESLDSRPNPEWYDDSKFGIFIHWGVFSVPALVSEWLVCRLLLTPYIIQGPFGNTCPITLRTQYHDRDCRFWYTWKTGNKQAQEFMRTNYPPDFTYADFAKDFHASFFDPAHWAKVFESSGAKYVILYIKLFEFQYGKQE